MNNNASLAHTRWDYTYRIVWIPKYRRKVLYGEVRDVLRRLVDAKDGIELLEGAVAKVMGNLKGKSALILFDHHLEWRGVTGRDRTFWAQGYYVSTVGLNEATIKKYVRNQEDASRMAQ